MEKVNMWTLLKESSESWNKYVAELHTPVQGKMKRYQPKSDKIEHIPLPLPISEHHKYVQLYISLIFVNGYPLTELQIDDDIISQVIELSE